MIRSLTGTIVSKNDQSVVLEVNGIGYLVATPHVAELPLNKTTTLHTYLAVRETALDLYGFLLQDELELFEQLLTLQKIGPKSALQIMCQANLELIKTAALNNDASHLSKMAGIGKKTAEKVVVGLADIYEKQGVVLDSTLVSSESTAGHVRDTIDALVTLGYPEHDARKAVQSVTETTPELSDTNELLKAALKLLS